ncbi:MAG: ATPase, T2SS/T4P/T4SS family [Planctomycetota bacterium]|nr:ATPase, T2SS/T4P/T4SS family [Planctomycetota bacterium]
MVEQRKFIGEILMEMGCVTQEDIDKALELQMAGEPRKIGEIFIQQGLCSSSDVTAALAEQYCMEMVDLDSIGAIDKSVVEMVPEDFAREHHVMPINLADGVLTVAISDPLDLPVLDTLRFMINCQVEPMLGSREAIDRAIEKYYGEAESELDRQVRDLTESVIKFEEKQEETLEADDAPVIKLINLLIGNAVLARASDIHVEPMANRVRIRYRIDGVCYEVDSPPKRLQGSVIARIKIMAAMDMAEKRRPQDGRIKMTMHGQDLDLRVSTLPATHGESVVMRILSKQSVKFGLEELGFHESDIKIFKGLIRKPNGILLITGPTGSGKTTTLYAALNDLNTPDRKIITAENPVEYYMPGINQCDIKPQQGMTFERALRAMLRQAPNIILIGEMRDTPTAEIGIQAALTGHLVFSTLHTNDAPSAITRLIDMGIQPFLVASSLQAVMAQRLVRTICPECKTPYEEDPVRLRAVGLRDDQFAGRTFYRGAGCPACRHVGFKGRKGIFEIMVMNNRLREMAFRKATTDDLREQARRDGMKTLLDDGLRKVLDGWTTLDEVLAEAKQYV